MTDREALLKAVAEWIREAEKKLQTEYGFVALPLIKIISQDHRFEMHVQRVVGKALPYVQITDRTKLPVRLVDPHSQEFMLLLAGFIGHNDFLSAPEPDFELPPGVIKFEDLQPYLGKHSVAILNILKRNFYGEYINHIDIEKNKYTIYFMTQAFSELILSCGCLEDFKRSIKQNRMRGFGEGHFATVQTALRQYLADRATHT